MKFLMMIWLTIVVCAMTVKGNTRGEALKELNARMLADIERKGKIMEKQRKENMELSDKTSMVEGLKKEITEALVNILYDELKKKTNLEVLQKRILDNTLKNSDAKRPLSLTPPPGLWAGKNDLRVSKEQWMRQEGKEDSMRADYKIRPPGLWGRELYGPPPGIWGKKEIQRSSRLWRGNREAKRSESGKQANQYFNSPPGLWGKEILSTKDDLSDANPPGLWGREMTSEVVRQPPGLWGKEVDEKTMSADIKETSDIGSSKKQN